MRINEEPLTIAVTKEISKICNGKHPPMHYVRNWLSDQRPEQNCNGDERLQAWVIDNTTTVDDETENLGTLQIEAAIYRAEAVLKDDIK